ncbi:efflux transporter outer membrane subunit [Methylocella tundrae]|uniref:RND transporter n=1 Tax=Methylocella tundrae TaxID=227605 RepID=A0A4U8Z6I7_METTU|nr:efflux transporter outer membrane subunit [Methylocella tundrae]WPP03044.1 efflux transporter outer membrane subunit [Methylocella tundrae]VFU16263.1 RND transporter [Methylocella tundrae]
MNRGARLGVLGLAAGLVGCAVGPDFRPPDTTAPEAFMRPPTEAARQRAPKSGADLTEWWRSLRDAELDSLVSRAIESNIDLQIALTRLQAARTAEFVVIGASLPAAGATGGGGIGTGTDLTRGRTSSAFRSAENRTNYKKLSEAGGFDATWELDLFGKFQRELEAVTYDAEALADARNWTMVTVAADVARAYLDMRALQRALVVLQKNIEVAKGGLNLAQTRFKQGLTNEMDVALAQRQLATLQASMAPYEAQIAANQHVIAVLLGQFPEDLAKELAKPGALPALPARIPPGLPVELLRRRPDIRAAEHQLAAATARIGVATADLFPRVMLSGGLGAQGGSHASSAVPITLIGAAGPAIYWPVLDFGTLDARVDIADLAAHELLLNYRQTILIAVQQVDDAIASYAAQQDRLKNLDRALSAARDATKLATDRYDRGLTDFLNVIDAERQQFDIEEQYVAAQQAAAQQLITLYKALGGGWELHQFIPPIAQPQPAVIAAARRLLTPPAENH